MTPDQQEIVRLKRELTKADTQISDMLDNDGEQWKLKYERQELRHNTDLNELTLKQDDDWETREANHKLAVTGWSDKYDESEQSRAYERSNTDHAKEEAAEARQKLLEAEKHYQSLLDRSEAQTAAAHRRRLRMKEMLNKERKIKCGEDLIKKVEEDANERYLYTVDELKEKKAELEEADAEIRKLKDEYGLYGLVIINIRSLQVRLSTLYGRTATLE